MVTIDITIDEDLLKQLVHERLQAMMGEVQLSPDDVVIEVKSSQNFKAEWEQAKFRARIQKRVT